MVTNRFETFHHWVRMEWYVLGVIFLRPSEISRQTPWPCQLQQLSCSQLWWHSEQLSASCQEQTEKEPREGESATLNTHGISWDNINNASITKFQEFKVIFQPLTRSNVFFKLSKLSYHVSCLTIQYNGIIIIDLTWMVPANHLSSRASCFHWWIILAACSNVAMSNIFERHVLFIETHHPQ